MPALSKESTAKDGAKDDAKPVDEALVNLCNMHATLNMFVSILNYTTRTELLKDLLKGDFAQTSAYMSMWTGVTALLEFCVNPTLGSLSDAYGRKPFMMMAPWAAFVLKSWVLINPSLTSLTVEKIVCDGLRTMAGTTMTSAALSDLVEGPQLAVYTAKLWAAMGLAILSAPIIASFFTARQTYMLAIAAALGQLGVETVYLRETLPESKRRPFEGFKNPLGMLKLFTTNAELTIVTTTVMLQNLVDVKIMSDPAVILQLDTLGWERSFVQRFTAVIGGGLLIGGKITKMSIGALGQHGHTTATHYTAIAADVILGMFPSSMTQWLSGFMGWYGNLMTNATKSMGTGLAVEAGMGKGEYSGLMANLRASMVVCGPILFGNIAYTFGRTIGMPGMPFLFAAMVKFMAEICHQKAKLALEAKEARTEASK